MTVLKDSKPSLLILGILATLLVACSDADPGSPTAGSDGPSYNMTLNMTDFMNMVLEPSADALWRSAGWVLDEVEGYYELYPTDDEGWERVRNQAAMIVEAGNAMMLPGRAMEQREWATYSSAMSTVALTAMRAATEQDEEALFQAGAQLYSVCTACHQAFNPEILSRFAPGSLSD